MITSSTQVRALDFKNTRASGFSIVYVTYVFSRDQLVLLPTLRLDQTVQEG
jgi:hypothetical protein